MPQIINTNMASLKAQRALNMSQSSMQTALQRLSSGLRINSAKDDAAGMAIAERFTSQIRGLNQAVRNANDGISLAQTAEGAMQEITNMMQRMREMAVQSSNDSNSSSDRQSLNQEYQALASEVKRVSIVTDFNSVFLLNGNQTLSFQVGWENGVNNIVTISTHSILSMSGVSAIGVGAAAGISTQLSANHLISVMDVAINKISTVRADFGSIQNRMEAAIRNMQNVSENQSAARSRVQDADFAAETAALTRAQILQQAGTAMLAQANQLPQNVLRLLQ